MAQSIFEQHEVLDQLFVELKRSYKQGELPSLEQLKQIAPELSFDEYQTLIERFSVYIHEQDLQQFYAQVKQLNQEMPLLPVQSSLQTSILALEQEFMKTMVRFLLNREQEIGKAATQKMQTLIQNNEDLQAQVQDLQAQQYELEDKIAQYQASFKKLKDAYATQSSVMAQLSMSEEALGLLRGALSCKDAASLRQLLSANNPEGGAYQEFALLIKLLPAITRGNILKLVDNAILLSQEKVAATSDEMFDLESDLLADDNATGPAPASVAASFAAHQDGFTTSMRAAAQTAAAATAAVADAADEVNAQLFSTEEQYLQSHLNLHNGAELTPEKFKQLHAALVKEQENLDDDEEGESLDLAALMRTKPTVASALYALRKTPTETEMADIETPAPAPVSLPESEQNSTYGEVDSSVLASSPLSTDKDLQAAFVAPQVVNPATTRISAMPPQQQMDNDPSSAMSIARTLSTVDHGTTNIVKLSEGSLGSNYLGAHAADPMGLGAAAAAAAAAATTGATAISRAAAAEAAINSAVSLFANANANTGVGAGAGHTNISSQNLNASRVPSQGNISADLLASLVPSSSPATAIVQSVATPQPQAQHAAQAAANAAAANATTNAATAIANAHAVTAAAAQAAIAGMDANVLGANGGAVAGGSAYSAVQNTVVVNPSVGANGLALSPAEESQAQALFDSIEKLCEQFFADKESTDITSLDLENVVGEAIEQELFAAQQAPLCRRLVLKMMMVGREKMQARDCFAKDEDVVASLPSEEQKQFARAVLAWGGTKVYLKKGAVDEATTHSSSVTNVVVTVPPTTPNVPFKVTAAASAPSANTAISGVSNLTPATGASNSSSSSNSHGQGHHGYESNGTLTLNDSLTATAQGGDGATEGKRSLTIDLKSLEAQHRAAALGDSDATIAAKVHAEGLAGAGAGAANLPFQAASHANLEFADQASLANGGDVTLFPESVAMVKPPVPEQGMAQEPDPEQESDLEIINRTSHALPRDEGSLVREISNNGDDSVAAFAAASAKIASLVQQPQSDGNNTSEGSAFLAPNQSGEQGVAALQEGEQKQKQETKAEIAAVAKDVLKVAQELEQGSSLDSDLFTGVTGAIVSQDLPEQKESIFGSASGQHLAGTTVLGLKDNDENVNSSQGSAYQAAEQDDSDFDDMISGPSTKDDDLDDFITGNIVDPNLESDEVLESQSLPEPAKDRGKGQVEPSAVIKPAPQEESVAVENNPLADKKANLPLQQNDAARSYPTSELATTPVTSSESVFSAALETAATAATAITKAPDAADTADAADAADAVGAAEATEPSDNTAVTAVEAAAPITAPAPESSVATNGKVNESALEQDSELSALDAAKTANTTVEEFAAPAPEVTAVEASVTPEVIAVETAIEAHVEQGAEAGETSIDDEVRDLEAAIAASTPVTDSSAPVPEAVDSNAAIEAAVESAAVELVSGVKNGESDDDEARELEAAMAASIPVDTATAPAPEVAATETTNAEAVTTAAEATATESTAIEAAIEASAEQNSEANVEDDEACELQAAMTASTPVDTATAPAPEVTNAEATALTESTAIETAIEANAEQDGEASVEDDEARELKAAMAAGTPVDAVTAPAPEIAIAEAAATAESLATTESTATDAAIEANAEAVSVENTAIAAAEVDVEQDSEASAEDDEARELQATMAAGTPVDDDAAPAPEAANEANAEQGSEASIEDDEARELQAAMAASAPVDGDAAPAPDAANAEAPATIESIAIDTVIEANAEQGSEASVEDDKARELQAAMAASAPVEAATAPAPEAINAEVVATAETAASETALEASAEQNGAIVGAELLQDERYQARLSLDESEREQFVAITSQLAESFNNQLSYLNNLLQNMKAGSSATPPTQEEIDENTVWVSDLDGDYQSFVEKLIKENSLSDKLVAALNEKMQEDLAKEQATSIRAEDFTLYPSLEVIAQQQQQQSLAAESNASDAGLANEPADAADGTESQGTLDKADKVEPSIQDSPELETANATNAADVSNVADAANATNIADAANAVANVSAADINATTASTTAVSDGITDSSAVTTTDAGVEERVETEDQTQIEKSDFAPAPEADDVYDDDEAMESAESDATDELAELAESAESDDSDESEDSDDAADDTTDVDADANEFAPQPSERKPAIFTFVTPDADDIATTDDEELAESQDDSDSHEDESPAPMQFSFESAAEDEPNTFTVDFAGHHEEPQESEAESSTEFDANDDESMTEAGDDASHASEADDATDDSNDSALPADFEASADNAAEETEASEVTGVGAVNVDSDNAPEASSEVDEGTDVDEANEDDEFETEPEPELKSESEPSGEPPIVPAPARGNSALEELKSAFQTSSESMPSRDSVSSVFNAFRAAAQAPEVPSRSNRNVGARLNLQDSNEGTAHNKQAHKVKSGEGENDPDPEPHPLAEHNVEQDSVSASVTVTAVPATDSAELTEHNESTEPTALVAQESQGLTSGYHEPDMSTAGDNETHIVPQLLGSGEQEAVVSAFTKADRSALQASQAAPLGLGSAYGAPTKATFSFHETPPQPQKVVLANSMHGTIKVKPRPANLHMQSLDNSTFNSANPYGGATIQGQMPMQPQLQPQAKEPDATSGSGADQH